MKILSTQFLSSRHLFQIFSKITSLLFKICWGGYLDLLRSGGIKESYMPPIVVNPLTVSENSNGKKRLKLDLRYIDQFVRKDRFKLDDWKTMMQYVKKGGYIFNFDLKNSYHHLDLFQSHQQGFPFLLRVELDISSSQFYVSDWHMGPTYLLNYWALLFDTGEVKVFRLLSSLMTMWVHIKILTFCLSQAKQVQSDLISAGFIINEEKSTWVPCQGLVWLGLYWNLAEGNLEIPEKRINKVIVLIRNIWCRMFGVSARTIASLAGLIISLSSSIGTITQLMTRHMYFVINNRSNWDSVWIYLNALVCTRH